MRFIPFYIAYKYLRSKKSSRFTSIISKSSVIGISLGIAAIIVVMSIMNGFHSEMRDKILSMVSHVIITEKNYTLKNWDKLKFKIDKNKTMMVCHGRVCLDDIAGLRDAHVPDVGARAARGLVQLLVP